METIEHRIKWAGQNYLYYKAQAARRSEESWDEVEISAREALMRLYDQLESELTDLVRRDADEAMLLEADRLQVLAATYLSGLTPAAHQSTGRTQEFLENLDRKLARKRLTKGGPGW